MNNSATIENRLLTVFKMMNFYRFPADTSVSSVHRRCLPDQLVYFTSCHTVSTIVQTAHFYTSLHPTKYVFEHHVIVATIILTARSHPCILPTVLSDIHVATPNYNQALVCSQGVYPHVTGYYVGKQYRPRDSSTKQYRCDYPGCARCYYDQSNLTRHKRNKHGLKPRRCSVNASAISVVHQSHDDSQPGQISFYEPPLEQLALDHDMTVPQQLNKDMYAPQQLVFEKDQQLPQQLSSQQQSSQQWSLYKCAQ